MENKTSESQLRASTKWNKKNKDKMNHIRNRSGAKKYILNSTLEEIQELENLIEQRKKELD